MKLSILVSSAICTSALFISFESMAYSSIATIKNHARTAWYRTSNYESQKEADNNALEGCRVEARTNGIGSLAKQCVIVTRAKGPGYGALSCGDDGCAWNTGYADQQEAVDEAYRVCAKSYTKCNSTNISVWEDFAGFKKAANKSAPTASNSCIPAGQVRRCRSQCTNGNCLVTYENGCKVRVQVQATYNSFNSQWEYPSPDC